MDNFNGDDLLNVFSSLEIKTGNLNPNVIRAWFDTDNEDMKNLLNWLCCSISKDNCITALEYSEFSKKSKKSPSELNQVEFEYPELLRTEVNEFDALLIDCDNKLISREISHIDKAIKMNEKLLCNLNSELSQKCSEKNEIIVRKKELEEECYNSMQKLDEFNNLLHNRIFNYRNNLIDNALHMKILDESCDFMEDFAVLEKFLQSYFDQINERFISDDVNNSREILSLSYHIKNNNKQCIEYKIKLEQLINVLDYLKSYDLSSTLAFMQDTLLESNIEAKRNEKCVLMKMLNNISSKITDVYMSHPRLKQAQHELAQSQLKLNYLNTVSDGLITAVTRGIMLNSIYSKKQKDHKDLLIFFQNVAKYIDENLNSCVIRNEAMSDIIEKYKLYKKQPFEKQFKLIQDCVTIFSQDCKCTLSDVLNYITNIKHQIANLEMELFFTSIENHLDESKNIVSNIDILQKFLISGPTCRVVSIPETISALLNENHLNINRQSTVLKSALQMFSDMLKKMSAKQFLCERRQLWMHFVSDPSKMFNAIEHIEKQYNKHRELLNKIQQEKSNVN